MLVWLVMRRDAGAVVPTPMHAFVNDRGEPVAVELIISTGTDQGRRQAGKIARLYQAGTPRILAELDNPRLLRMRRSGLVLTGFERRSAQHDRISCVQTWVCTFAPPFDACEQKVAEQIVHGMAIPKSRVLDGGWAGHIEVGQMHVSELGWYATVASFIAETSGQEAKRLLDADIVWMGQDRFALAGISTKAAYRDEPAALFEGSWLSTYQRRVDYDESGLKTSSKGRH